MMIPFLRSLVLFVFALWCLSLSASGEAGSQEGGPPCLTYASCNERGTAALRHGRSDAAIQFFEQQAALAELADIGRQSKSRNILLHSPCKLALTAYNNLAVAYLNKHDYFQAHSWALVAMHCDKDNRAAQFNLRNIGRALKSWQWPKSPEGEYVQYAGRGTWESFIVEPSPPGNIHICFSGLWWGLGEGPSGLGELTGTVPFHDNEAEYTTSEFTNKKCAISMRLYDDRLEVKQTGDEWDCGFGHNVTANGTFQRISTGGKCATNEK